MNSHTIRRAGVGLGSNIEPRRERVESAAAFLRGLNDGGPFLMSSLHETAPVGCPPGAAPFLNAAVEFSTPLGPAELLGRFQAFERSAGREVSPIRNAPRTIDLDLLYLDDLVLSTPELTLPHPRMTERAFVLVPLAEIAPDRILPGQSQTIAGLAATFPQP